MEQMLTIQEVKISKTPLETGEKFTITVRVKENYLDYPHDYKYDYTSKEES